MRLEKKRYWQHVFSGTAMKYRVNFLQLLVYIAH